MCNHETHKCLRYNCGIMELHNLINLERKFKCLDQHACLISKKKKT